MKVFHCTVKMYKLNAKASMVKVKSRFERRIAISCGMKVSKYFVMYESLNLNFLNDQGSAGC